MHNIISSLSLSPRYPAPTLQAADSTTRIFRFFCVLKIRRTPQTGPVRSSNRTQPSSTVRAGHDHSFGPLHERRLESPSEPAPVGVPAGCAPKLAPLWLSRSET